MDLNKLKQEVFAIAQAHGTTQITEGVFHKKWGTYFSSYIY